MAELVVATARQVVAGSGVAPDEVVHAVVGTPGVYDEKQRRVRYAMHLPGWGRAGLFDRMREELGIPWRSTTTPTWRRSASTRTASARAAGSSRTS